MTRSPLRDLLVGVFVLGEALSGVQVLAFSIALVGVLLATLPTRQQLKLTNPAKRRAEKV